VSDQLRIISFGGGVQSTALLVLAAQGVVDFPAAVFSNVGDRAENPATLAYVAEHARPFAAEHGVELHEVRWRSKGRDRDLYDDLVGSSRSIDIPVKMAGGAPGHRKCTDRYKIAVIRRWCEAHGATAASPATIAVGFSTDEVERASSRHSAPTENVVYPLLELGLSRSGCARVIREAGLPVPPKSSCWFCPFQRPQQWAEMRRDQPGMFAAAVALEERLNEKREGLGKDHVYLGAAGTALAELTEAQTPLFGDGPDTCDSWGCWT
jgi:hypothetical protein